MTDVERTLSGLCSWPHSVQNLADSTLDSPHSSQKNRVAAGLLRVLCR